MNSTVSRAGAILIGTLVSFGSHCAPAAPGALNQWTAIGPDASEIFSLAVAPTAPSTIYIGRSASLMKTTDGGAHWVDVAPFPGFARAVVELAVEPGSPSTAYAIYETIFPGGGNIHKSVDAGDHWIDAYPDVSDDGSRRVSIAASQPSTLFLVGSDVAGVMRSTDAGASWTFPNDGLPVGRFGTFSSSALAIDPTSADIVYVATKETQGRFDRPDVLFKSSDRGEHWRQLPIPLPLRARIEYLAVDPMVSATLYVAYLAVGNHDAVGAVPGEAGVMKSADGGETWMLASTFAAGTSVSTLVIDSTDGRKLYAATNAGVLVSGNGGGSWSSLEHLPSRDVHAISIDRTGKLLRAGTSAGLFEYRFAEPSQPGHLVPVVEYRHAESDHYFMTAFPDEIGSLDSGSFVGWTRTGLQFNAYSGPVAGASPVCRFYSTAFNSKNSHFYSPFASECDILEADTHWMLETADAFNIALPNADGACPADFAPVFRLYNNGQGGAPNHRYTTDRGVRSQMIADGWVPEGVGAEGVQMCSSP
jgi:photosystem II stability/assembly factor-like uncharacterized protein